MLGTVVWTISVVQLVTCKVKITFLVVRFVATIVRIVRLFFPTMLRFSRLANCGEICIWRLVGHCNTFQVGSVKARHWCSSQEDPNTLGSSKYKYYVLHLRNEPFPRNVSDLEVVKNEPFPLLYPDFDAWKKVGGYSVVQDNTVMQLLPTFFPDIEIMIHWRKPVILDTFQITDTFGK